MEALDTLGKVAYFAYISLKICRYIKIKKNKKGVRIIILLPLGLR